MASAQSATAYRNLLHRIQDLLRRKPDLYDVVFCVGPAQKEVKAVRILLAAASPALERKFEFWDSAPVRGESWRGIPIPDFDPEAFEIFVKVRFVWKNEDHVRPNLTMLDEWTVQSLNVLKLEPVQIINLICICREYKMETALEHLEAVLKSYYIEFTEYKNTKEFLLLSHTHLQAILMSDNLPMNELDIFECACRWAKNECKKKEMEGNAENLRLVLGKILFEIRFPLMSPQEFTQCSNTHSILTPAEGFQIFKFISSNETQRLQLDASQMPFKTKARIAPVYKFCLKMDSPIVDVPPFVCDGSENCFKIRTKKKILVHALGFLGPIHLDTHYDVTVRFTQSGSDHDFEPKTIQKRIFAKKGSAFRIIFDQPVAFAEGLSSNYYSIFFSLKGRNTKSFQREFGYFRGFTYLKSHGDNEFGVFWYSNQLAEILYSNI